MPRYTIQDPQTGRTITLEGDSPPTEQELEQIFASMSQQQAQPVQSLTGENIDLSEKPDPTWQDYLRAARTPQGGSLMDLVGTADAAQTVLSSLVGNIVGGLEGIGTGINPLTDKSAADATTEMINRITIAPQTSEGRRQLAKLGDAFSFLAEFQQDIGESGVSSAEALGVESPEAKAAFGATGETMVAAIPELLGLRGIQAAKFANTANRSGSHLGGAIANISDNAAKEVVDMATSAPKKPAFQMPYKRALAERVIKGEADPALAKYIVNSEGKLKTSKAAKEAIAQGFDPAVLQPAKGATKADKMKFLEMINIRKKGLKDRLFLERNRPHDVAGKTVKDLIGTVQKANRKAGRDIERVAVKRLKGKPLDSAEIGNQFNQMVNNLGIGISRKADGSLNVNFKDSVLAPSDRAPIKEVIRQMERISKKDGGDAFAAHKLKRIIDNNLNYKAKEAMSQDGQRALLDLRRSIDDALDKKFPDYDAANKAYAETIGILNEWQRLAGKNNPLDMPNIERVFGNLLNRESSNATSSAQIINASDELTKIASKYGAKVEQSPSMQILMANEIDRVIGAAARTSFEGRIGAATESVVQQGVSPTITAMAAKKTGEALDTLRGINKENALKSLEETIKEALR